MDGSGQEQVSGRGGSESDDALMDATGAPIRKEGRGQDRHGGGAFTTDRSDKAVDIQSIVEKDDYAGSAESGI